MVHPVCPVNVGVGQSWITWSGLLPSKWSWKKQNGKTNQWVLEQQMSNTAFVFLKVYFILFMSVYACVSKCRTHKYQKRVLDPLKLEFQVFVSFLMWVLRLECWSSDRAIRALNFYAISSAPTEMSQRREWPVQKNAKPSGYLLRQVDLTSYGEIIICQLGYWDSY